mgnify:CR=1
MALVPRFIDAADWFNYFCKKLGLDAEQTVQELITRTFPGQILGFFDYETRQQAGFTATELSALEPLQNCTQHSELMTTV